MIETAIAAQTAATTRLADILDRIADALETGSDVAALEARVAALEGKTGALEPAAAAPPTATMKPKRATTLPTGKVAAPAKTDEPVVETSTPPVVDTPAEPAREPLVITHDTLRALGRNLIKQDGNPVRFKAIIAQHGADTISALAEDKLAAVETDIKALLQ